ncbi:hypothetical protein ACQWU4_17780 [Chryseobacterium sp. MIQD13]|uniref:hypothetical protein n=1 Tax=Chryseobacterium sp. MIQD13 TaxID=3422310 RepID=UPI003D2C14B4
MKNFIEIKGWNDVVYKVNINQITHIYTPDKPETPMEQNLNVILSRVFLSCGTEMVTKSSIAEIEQLITDASNK